MSADSFLTIKQATIGEYKDKGSKFIAFAHPINSEEQAKEIIDILRKEHHGARHHCWAYRLGAQKSSRANDDGEPSNSAGKPILGQIVAFDLSNVLIVVVRYFGGRLLGVGGLIQAYKSAAFEALTAAEIIEYQVEDLLQITSNYLQINSIMKIIKDSNLQIQKQHFDNECQICVKIRQSESISFKNKFEAITGTKVEIIE